MKRILITGGDGFLGARIASCYQDLFPDSVEVIRAGHGALDITEEGQALQYVEKCQPDVVFHCAAISNTGACQENKALSEAVNLHGTVHMARACREMGGRLIFMSSDQVYGGSRLLRPNREEEAVPVNVYGAHKKEAEDQIMKLLPDAVCLRLPWMYDFPSRGMKCNSNLLCGIIKALIHNQPMKMAVNDYRGITYVREVVRNLDKAMNLPGGVYNFGSPEMTSSYEAALALVRMLAPGREDMVIPDEGRFASQPRNLSMDLGKLRACGIDFPDTIDGLKQCLEDNPAYVGAFFQ